uniref:Protein kinase domain-containing protein n=1 Tax=Ananas comosus var. bracteatus TaxID=296719 RepID=A0A6V7Q3M7_ANACO|nr:unnamed protein product [Ananas comosus var. bracteatus]
MRNRLSGPIPYNIFNSSSIERISLANNTLSGCIPVATSSMTNLQVLSLAYNQLIGTIPAGLGNLHPGLLLLSLGANNLTGSIPPSFANLTQLTELELSYNELQGSVPAELGRLNNLQVLHADQNSLTGALPESIFNVSSLLVLSLASNMLTGSIPESMRSGGPWLPILQEFHLNDNQLGGPILRQLSRCKNLTKIVLDDNRFDGNIPAELGDNLLKLTVLSFNNNNLSGPIPTTLGNLTALTILDFGSNSLRGAIPCDLGRLESLQYLYMDENYGLTGEIPSAIFNITSLQILDLTFNNLSGRLPIDVGHQLPNLWSLNLGRNMLDGEIPTSITNCSMLTAVDLSYNSFHGPVPATFDNLQVLYLLNLAENQLNGGLEFLSPLANCKKLAILSFGNNEFQGSLPAAIGNLSRNLQQLYASDLQLSGNIPATIGNLTSLIKLDLTVNELRGKIPSSIGLLENLQQLFLRDNKLEGSVLEELFMLRNLGSIPNSLTRLRYLNNLNLSYNRLVGEIPQGGAFNNLTSNSFMETWLCAERKDSKFRRKRVKEVRAVDQLDVNNHRRISYRDLLRATDNFNEANLVGSGSFGSVYKGRLDDGLPVAVKVLNLQLQKASASFTMECQALSTIRHRNLVKIISTCSNLEFKAIILQYMPNGSLEKWLYSHNYCLNFTQRIEIMMDVALALEYLHHHCPTPVVHCDLKPSNILMDENMIAHLSDFGIAKLLSEGDSCTVLTSAPGTIGYIAPEYGQVSKVSTSGDVYSYAFLLEAFSRRNQLMRCSAENRTYDDGFVNLFLLQ